MPRTRAQVIVAVLYVATSISQLHQVPRETFGEDALPALAALHAASGLSSLATAVGTWLAYRWSWLLSLLWGVVTSALILSLPRLLRLTAEESVGMPIGAAVVMATALAGAWYLHRAFGSAPIDREREQ
jgi:sorbitol-specific phosphotransferase system component IIBC